MARRPRTRTFVWLVAAALLAAIGALVAWLALRDPLAALPRATGPAEVVAVEPLPSQGARALRRTRLRAPGIGEVGLVLNLPEAGPDQPLPVLVVLGGLGPGERTLRHIPAAGHNAFVAYDWPIPRELPSGLAGVREAYGLYRRVLAVPGEVAAGLAWLATQPWADAERISLLGFSLGALAVPAAQHLTQAAGQRVGWTVLAYGGADLGHLVARHPRTGPDWLRPLVGAAAGLAFRPLDPAVHLPRLDGRFLVIGAADDRLVPRRSATLLRELTPEPKTVLRLGGAHIGTGPDPEALLEEIVRRTGRWLIEAGAVDPP